MRRLILVLTALALTASGAAMAVTRQPISKAASPLWAPGPLLVLVVPEAEARAVLPDAPAGLGVLPESHRATEFLTEISAGAPRSLKGVRSPLRGRLGLLREVLEEAGVSVEIAAAPGAAIDLAEAVRAAFSSPLVKEPAGGSSWPPGSSARLTVVVASTAKEVRSLAVFRRSSLVVGIPDAGGSPVTVMAEQTDGPGVLGAGITRRPALVTPYDVSATILEQLGVPRSQRFIGRPLRLLRGAGGTETVEALRARLVRDLNVRTSLTAYTVGWIIGLVVIALFVGLLGARWRMRAATHDKGELARRVAQRLATGSVLATTAYVAGLFISSARGDIRALVIVAAVIVGLAVKPRDPVRFAAGVFFALASVVIVLEIWAALRPGAEPALSLWGNPLESWRFYGLANHFAGFIVSGVVIGGAALGLCVPCLLAAAVVSGLVVAAPFLGANFVAVFLLGFGVVLAALAARTGSFRLWHPVAALGFGAAGFVAALVSDTGSATSHGGQAVERIANGGWGTIGDYIRDRLSLNAESIRTFTGWPVWVVLVAAMLTIMVWWSLTGGRLSAPRIAIVAGVAVAVTAMVVEDSGFLMGVGLGSPALVLWTLLVLAPGSAFPGARMTSADVESADPPTPTPPWAES